MQLGPEAAALQTGLAHSARRIGFADRRCCRDRNLPSLRTAGVAVASAFSAALLLASVSAPLGTAAAASALQADIAI